MCPGAKSSIWIIELLKAPYEVVIHVPQQWRALFCIPRTMGLLPFRRRGHVGNPQTVSKPCTGLCSPVRESHEGRWPLSKWTGGVQWEWVTSPSHRNPWKCENSSPEHPTLRCRLLSQHRTIGIHNDSCVSHRSYCLLHFIKSFGHILGRHRTTRTIKANLLMWTCLVKSQEATLVILSVTDFPWGHSGFWAMASPKACCEHPCALNELSKTAVVF